MWKKQYLQIYEKTKRTTIFVFASLLLAEPPFLQSTFANNTNNTNENTKVFKKHVNNSIIRVEEMGDPMQIQKKTEQEVKPPYLNSLEDMIKLNPKDIYLDSGFRDYFLKYLQDSPYLSHTLTKIYYSLLAEKPTDIINVIRSNQSLDKDTKEKISKLFKKYEKQIREICDSYINKEEKERDALEKKLYKELKKELSSSFKEEKFNKFVEVFINGPYGHKLQQFESGKILALAYALTLNEEKLKDLLNALKDNKSFQRDKEYIHFGNVLLYDWIKEVLPKNIESEGMGVITKLMDVKIGWKDGDSLLYQNNDKAAMYPNGYASGQVVPNVSNADDVWKELQRIATLGRISSSFDAGLHYAGLAGTEQGNRYEATKLYSAILVFQQLLDSIERYENYPDVQRYLPELAWIFYNESYKALISAVSAVSLKDPTEINNQLKKAEAIAKFFYYFMPKILEKSKEIVGHGINSETYEPNKPDYYEFLPYLVKGVFKLVREGGEIKEGVPDLGAYHLEFDPKISPLKKHLDSLQDKSSEDIKALAQKLIDAVSGKCMVQQVRFDIQLSNYNEKEGTVRITINTYSSPYILDSQGKINIPTYSIKTPVFAGLPGSWSASYNLSEKEQQEMFSPTIFNSIKKIPKRYQFSIPVSQLNIINEFAVIGKSGGQYLKPYEYKTPYIEIPALEPTPIQIPFPMKQNIENGGSIGGVPVGFDDRYGNDSAYFLKEALVLQKNAGQDPRSLIQVNQLLYNAIEKAYNHISDKSLVGGEATRKWLEENKANVKSGNLTPLPKDLLSSAFGSESSLVNVPNQLKMDEVRTVNAMDLSLSVISHKKPLADIYLKGGWIDYQRKMWYRVVSGYDDSGNPVFKSNEKVMNERKGLGGIGYHLGWDNQKKLKIELFGTKGDTTLKLMSEEDRTLLEKFGHHILKEWEGKWWSVTGKKFVELINLFDEISIANIGNKYSGYKTFVQARTSNLSLPLSVPLGWIGIKANPSLTWHSVFSGELEEGKLKLSANKEFGNILELNAKPNKYSWSIWEYTHGDPFSPSAIGIDVGIKRSELDLRIGLGLVPKPGNKMLDLSNIKNITKNNVPTVNVSIRF